MHKLLERQLREYVGAVESIPPEWTQFLLAVDDAYRHADVERGMMERSLDAASKMLARREQQLEQQAVAQEAESRLLEAQSQALLEVIGSITLGEWDVEVQLPEASSKCTKALYELAVAMRTMIGTLQARRSEWESLQQEQGESAQLLDERVRALDCLNEVGRKLDLSPPVPELLSWVAERLPRAMRYPEDCRAAIRFEDKIYGPSEAVDLPCQIVQGLRVGDQAVGRLYISYIQEHDFADRESAFLGDLARRIGGYVERRQLFDQTQAALAQAEAAHRRYLRQTWDAFLAGRERAADGYVADESGVQPIGGPRTVGMGQALRRDGEAGGLEEVGRGDGESALPLAVPLKSRGGQIIGVLDLWREDGRSYTPSERELVDTLAEQVAEIILAEQLFEQTQKSLAETRRLYDAGRRIAGAESPQGVFRAVMDVVSSTVADRAAIYTFDKRGPAGGAETFILVDYWDRRGEEPPPLLDTRYRRGDHPLFALLSRDQPTIVANVSSDEPLSADARAVLSALGGRAAAIVPLAVGREWLGFTLVVKEGQRPFTEDEVRIYAGVNNQAAMALRSLRLLYDAENRVRREQIIREITSKISDTVELDTILSTAVQELGRALGVSRAFVRLSTEPGMTPTGNAPDDGSRAEM
jgi:GAF domain-containing protein